MDILGNVLFVLGLGAFLTVLGVAITVWFAYVLKDPD